ncbi:MAG: hypothetical protein QUS14_12755 [Pyrinomonadaceae bacterium]|nr:hypothetical protein [Pyrinomonadaceae bacterium]
MIRPKIFQFLVLAVILAAASPVFADQAAWVSRAEAERALKLLASQQVVRHYCAPCGDKSVRSEVVESIGLFKVEDSEYWEIRVNGKGVDLAYIYFLKKRDRWVNAAMAADIDVSDVPEELPANLPVS